MESERKRFDDIMTNDVAFRQKFIATRESIQKGGVSDRVDAITKAANQLGFNVTREEMEAAARGAGIIK